jgi:ATP-dependent DNA helicase RecG
MFTIFENPEFELILQQREDQLFDRKSERIDFIHLCDEIVGFSNADGGVIVIGIDKDKSVTGVTDPEAKINEIRKAVMKYIKPPASVEIKPYSCKNHKNEDCKLLLIEIHQGTDIHANIKDEVFLRIGNENLKLNHEQITLLLDDRGKSNFELTEANGASIEDLSIDNLELYKHSIGIPSITTEDLLIGRDLAKKDNGKLIINMAGILLFGQNPEKWVERSRIRILKYEGLVEKTGQDYNIVKDSTVYGPLPQQIKRGQEILGSFLREFTVLDKYGKFITQPEYPEYAWREIITNAVVHRSYAMRGADIQIKVFEDKLEIISPGRFPGPVNENNIQETHYSRNPRIARAMSELGFVKELGEGVNRIYMATKAANLPPPVFTEKANSEVLVRLENNISTRALRKDKDEITTQLEQEVFSSLNPIEQKIILFVSEYKKITTKECVNEIKRHRTTAVGYLRSLTNRGMLKQVGNKGPNVHYILGIKLNLRQN